jgi:hypothetical protein
LTRTTDLAGILRLAEPVLGQRASGQVDRDLGQLKELLAITRTAATATKGC